MCDAHFYFENCVLIDSCLKHTSTTALQRNQTFSQEKLLDKISTGNFKDEDGLLPSFTMIPKNMPFEFKLLQISCDLQLLLTKHNPFKRVYYISSIQACHMDISMACSRVGKPFKFIHLRTRWKIKKYCVSHSTSINIELKVNFVTSIFFRNKQNQETA